MMQWMQSVVTSPSALAGRNAPIDQVAASLNALREGILGRWVSGGGDGLFSHPMVVLFLKGLVRYLDWVLGQRNADVARDLFCQMSGLRTLLSQMGSDMAAPLGTTPRSVFRTTLELLGCDEGRLGEGWVL